MQVGDHQLSSIAVQGNLQSGGQLVAVGDVNGTVSLIEVCEGLAVSQPNEKVAILGVCATGVLAGWFASIYVRWLFPRPPPPTFAPLPRVSCSTTEGFRDDGAAAAAARHA